MSKFTQKQKEKYLKYGGIKCPHCESNDLEPDKIEIDGFIAFQYITCSHCKKEWIDNYALDDITEI